MQNKSIFARIIALDRSEAPIEAITGRTTQGSINIDGNSAVRRTCSLTLVTDSFDYHDYYWAYKTKFKLEVGVENTINPNYPDICWFNQGIYIITSINTSRSTNNFTITIQGRDKMCLLDGSIGGSLEAQTDFGKIEEENNDGEWVMRSIPIQEIIRNMLHNYAHEPYHNIVINDLDTYGLELLEYRYDEPIYLIRRHDETEQQTNHFSNIIMNRKCKYENQDTELNQIPYTAFTPLIEGLFPESKEPIEIGGVKCDVAKIQYGDTAGYRITDLVYAGELIANVGESLTSVLDKIKNMLVEFEYFYDVDGRFIFQKKQSFINTMWSLEDFTKQGNDFEGLVLYNDYEYDFTDTTLFTALNINPNIQNVRNDYSIWGTRKTTQGAEIPIHLRYAIDNKPVQYTTIEVADTEVKEYNERYNSHLKGQESQTYTVVDYDWREIIYQMALDYFRYSWMEDFERKVAAANPDLYPTGRTGYEQYYTDIQGFWRQLYNPFIEQDIIKKENQYKKLIDEREKNSTKQGELESKKTEYSNSITDLTTKLENDVLNFATETDVSKRQQLFGEDSTGTSIYDTGKKKVIAELALEEVNINLTALLDRQLEIEQELQDLEAEIAQLNEDIEKYKANNWWNTDVTEHPELLNFWFDFLDSQGELYQISVPEIGPRAKSINDKDVKSIYNRDTPSVIFTDNITQTNKQFKNTGYNYIQVNDLENMFSISAQGKSAKNRLDELLYQHGYACESVSITCVPIYYLNPNTRIYIKDEETNIDGDYILSKFNIPLTYNGTMNLTVTKAAEYLI